MFSSKGRQISDEVGAVGGDDAGIGNSRRVAAPSQASQQEASASHRTLEVFCTDWCGIRLSQHTPSNLE